jgi:hypothetical protein
MLYKAMKALNGFMVRLILVSKGLSVGPPFLILIVDSTAQGLNTGCQECPMITAIC